MFDRFTIRTQRLLVLAKEAAALRGHDFVGTEHLLIGLLTAGEGGGVKVLVALGISPTHALELTDETIGFRAVGVAPRPLRRNAEAR